MMKRYYATHFLLLFCCAIISSTAQAQSLHTVVKQSQDISLDDFEETGKRRRCLNFMKIERFKAVTENELLFVEKGELYRNIPRNSCGGSTNFRNKFVFSSDGGRICRGSSIMIFAGGSDEIIDVCFLGDFKLLRLREGVSESAPDEE